MHVLILATHRAPAAGRLVERIIRQLRAERDAGMEIGRVTDLRRLDRAFTRQPDIVLVPLVYEGDGGFRAAVQAVRVVAPGVPIVACCDVSVPPGALLAAAGAQVDHFAVPAVDDVGFVVRDVLAPGGAAQGARPRGQQGEPDHADELFAALPPTAARLMIAAAAGDAPATVAGLARVVGLSERTLTRRCARHQWPTPTMMLQLGRLLRGMRVALATGSIEEGARAADCPGEPARAATYFRARLAAATSGALRQPLADGLVPLCVVIAERFGVTHQGQRPRRRLPRRRRTRRPTLASEGIRLEEGGDDGLEGAGGAELERPAPRVPLELGPEGAG